MHAFMIIARIVEHELTTAPWLAYETFLHATIRRSRCDDGGLPPLFERVSMLAAMLVLLGAHLEYALDVTAAAVSGGCSAELQAAIDHVAANQPAGTSVFDIREAVLQQAVLRAHRNGQAYSHVARLFRVRVHELLAVVGVITVDGALNLQRSHAEAYMLSLRDRARELWGQIQPTPARQPAPCAVKAKRSRTFLVGR